MHLNGHHLLVRSKAVRGRERLRRRPDRLRRLGQSSGARVDYAPNLRPALSLPAGLQGRRERSPEPRSAGCGHRAHARRNETFGASGPERKRNTVKKMISRRSSAGLADRLPAGRPVSPAPIRTMPNLAGTDLQGAHDAIQSLTHGRCGSAPQRISPGRAARRSWIATGPSAARHRRRE